MAACVSDPRTSARAARQITTGSKWYNIANGCTVDPDGQPAGQSINYLLTQMYFTAFLVAGNMVVPYLFTAALLENFFDSMSEANQEEKLEA